MNKKSNSPENLMVMTVAQQLSNFRMLLSIEADSGNMDRGDHGCQDSESKEENQNSYPCANCGRPAAYGIFCSTSCEMDIVG
jgi:hypothetical protein